MWSKICIWLFILWNNEMSVWFCAHGSQWAPNVFWLPTFLKYLIFCVLQIKECHRGLKWQGKVNHFGWTTPLNQYIYRTICVHTVVWMAKRDSKLAGKLQSKKITHITVQKRQFKSQKRKIIKVNISILSNRQRAFILFWMTHTPVIP